MCWIVELNLVGSGRTKHAEMRVFENTPWGIRKPENRFHMISHALISGLNWKKHLSLIQKSIPKTEPVQKWPHFSKIPGFCGSTKGFVTLCVKTWRVDCQQWRLKRVDLWSQPLRMIVWSAFKIWVSVLLFSVCRSSKSFQSLYYVFIVLIVVLFSFGLCLASGFPAESSTPISSTSWTSGISPGSTCCSDECPKFRLTKRGPWLGKNIMKKTVWKNTALWQNTMTYIG